MSEFAPKPTSEEVQAEIALLEELEPHVRHYTLFGDNNWSAMEVQLRVLRGDYDEDDIDLRYGDDDHLYSNAREAIDWLNGDYEIVEGQSKPSDGWKQLIVDGYVPQAEES